MVEDIRGVSKQYREGTGQPWMDEPLVGDFRLSSGLAKKKGILLMGYMLMLLSFTY